MIFFFNYWGEEEIFKVKVLTYDLIHEFLK